MHQRPWYLWKERTQRKEGGIIVSVGRGAYEIITSHPPHYTSSEMTEVSRFMSWGCLVFILKSLGVISFVWSTVGLGEQGLLETTPHDRRCIAAHYGSRRMPSPMPFPPLGTLTFSLKGKGSQDKRSLSVSKTSVGAAELFVSGFPLVTTSLLISEHFTARDSTALRSDSLYFMSVCPLPQREILSSLKKTWSGSSSLK